MTLIVDIDCVLNDLIFKMLSLYNHRSGKNIHVEDIVTYEFDQCLPREDATAFNNMFKERVLWDSLEPLPGSQEGLKKLLQRGHDIVIATATDPVNFAWKVEWMERYFPFIDSGNIIRIKNKGLLNGDVIIDDCYDQLKSCMCDRIVLDYPWNRNESWDYVYDTKRARNWSEIVSIMNQIEKEERKWNSEV